MGELVNASAARLNKEVALGSNLRRSLMDPEPPAFAAASSSYKADFCADHKAVGRWAVVHSPEAMSAVSGSSYCIVRAGQCMLGEAACCGSAVVTL